MVFIAFLVLSIRQTPNQPATAPPVKEVSAEEMSKVLRDLEPAQDIQSYWELVGPDGKTVGCSSTRMSSMLTNGQQGMRYITEMGMKLPDGTRVELEVEAHLTHEYEPTFVKLLRTIENPEKQRKSWEERAEVKVSEVILKRQVDDASPVSRVVPRPESPFVFGIECIIGTLDCGRYSAFELREFNPQEGKIIGQHFRVQNRPAGGHVVVSSKDNGSPNYRFEIDDKGSIVSWSETPPLALRISTEKRVLEIRKELFK